MDPDKKQEKKCPSCGSTEIIPICYGKPSYEGFQKSQRGEIILGGCIMRPNAPHNVCKECNKRW